jgi:antitoxin component YwqK of YwqJK toxin-antitoxin module
MQQYITTMEKSKINLKYKKIPHNDNAIEIDGKVVLSFDARYKEYLKWREENPDLEKSLIKESEQEALRVKLYNNGAPHETKDESGKLQGRRTFYYENGNKKWDGEYKDNKLHGHLIQYRENGIKKSDEEFQNGIHIGKYKYYHPNGKLRQEGNIREPHRQHGEIKSYWTSGNLKRIDTFNYGIRQGKVETYEVDGKSVIQTGQYENNYRTGDWLVYYLGSKDKLKRAETYDHSVMVKVVDWNKNGQKVSEAIKGTNMGTNQVLVGSSWRNFAWYDNGVKKHDRVYLSNKGHGKWTEWYSTGIKRAEGDMKYDAMQGKWTFWNHIGNKELECEFDFGEAVNKAKIWNDNGELKQEIKL